MKQQAGWGRRAWAVLALTAGCGTPGPAASGSDAAADRTAPPDTGAADVPVAGDGGVSGVRGRRYCEVLSGTLSGGNVRLDVYNTFGLNDCPEEPWRRITVESARAELMTPVVVLNGPRYWMIDGFLEGTVLDPTVRTIGGIEMRVTGRLEVPLAAASGGSQPYVTRTVRRDTTVVFLAGRPVFELVDPTGRVFDLQSYSVQSAAQTEDSLATLGARLTLPTGWSFRTRTLSSDLRVVAVAGMATVVTDDFNNAYQLSQQ